jgi:transporter family protein
MWIFLALMSAFLTAAVAVVSKIGMKNVDSSFGFAIQSIVIVIVSWGYVLLTGKAGEHMKVEGKDWGFLALTGLLSTIAYLFYFAAVKNGDVSRVAPIDRLSLVFSIVLAAVFLSERVNSATIFGAGLMVVGALVIAVFGAGGK